MKLVPHNKYIVCKQVSEEAEKVLAGGIVINQQDPMTQYEVVNPGSSGFQVGSIVVSNSIPTKACLGN